jgi:hypothetical protein
MDNRDKWLYLGHVFVAIKVATVVKKGALFG